MSEVDSQMDKAGNWSSSEVKYASLSLGSFHTNTNLTMQLYYLTKCFNAIWSALAMLEVSVKNRYHLHTILIHICIIPYMGCS